MKLHIGCGRRDFGKDWLHIDGADFPHVQSHDVFLNQYADNFAEVIYSAHFIEYFDREEVGKLLKSWHRVLKPRCELLVSVPDFDAIAKLYSDKEYELEQFLGLLYGRMPLNDSIIYHKTVYNYKSLCKVLATAGFYEMEKHDRREGMFSPVGQDDHSCAVLPHMSATGIPVSLNVRCYKL